METDKSQQHDSGERAPFRKPDEWKTGDEPITAAQRSYLKTLATEAGVPFDESEPLTKAEAAKRIEQLQRQTGRGQGGGGAF